MKEVHGKGEITLGKGDNVLFCAGKLEEGGGFEGCPKEMTVQYFDRLKKGTTASRPRETGKGKLIAFWKKRKGMEQIKRKENRERNVG